MSLIDKSLSNAIDHVFKIKKENPEWPISFIVGKVSAWHGLSFHLIMEEIKIRGKNKKPVVKKKELDQEIGKDGYPKSAPWWIKN